jgi:uncharacterized LabA/DUF88 family protein
MSTIEKPWMMFVDGENLTIRAREVAKVQGVDLTDGRVSLLYEQDVCFWPASIIPDNHSWTSRVHMSYRSERSYYYTSTPGDLPATEAVHDRLQAHGFSPVVFHKPKGQKAKGVDIALTKDMLLHAFFGHYDVAVLVTGDGDYVPVVEEVKRLGRRVIVAFFDCPQLSAKLRRTADEFYPLQLRG